MAQCMLGKSNAARTVDFVTIGELKFDAAHELLLNGRALDWLLGDKFADKHVAIYVKVISDVEADENPFRVYEGRKSR